MHLAGLEIISKRVNPSAPSNLCCAALWLEATQDPHWAYGGSLETLRCPRQSRVRTRLIPPPLGVVSYPRHTEGWRLGCTCYLQMTLPAAVFVWSTVLLKKKKITKLNQNVLGRLAGSFPHYCHYVTLCDHGSFYSMASLYSNLPCCEKNLRPVTCRKGAGEMGSKAEL